MAEQVGQNLTWSEKRRLASHNGAQMFNEYMYMYGG